MKKYILTETQIKSVVDNLISEQTDESNYKKAVQCFLNKRLKTNLKIDGDHGDETSKAIVSFQELKGIYPVDGRWGSDCTDKMNSKEKQVFDTCINEFSDIIDKGLKFLNLK